MSTKPNLPPEGTNDDTPCSLSCSIVSGPHLRSDHPGREPELSEPRPCIKCERPGVRIVKSPPPFAAVGCEDWPNCMQAGLPTHEYLYVGGPCRSDCQGCIVDAGLSDGLPGEMYPERAAGLAVCEWCAEPITADNPAAKMQDGDPAVVHYLPCPWREEGFAERCSRMQPKLPERGTTADALARLAAVDPERYAEIHQAESHVDSEPVDPHDPADSYTSDTGIDTTEFPPSDVAVSLGVCDGQCVPDECVCPSSAERVAEIQAAVKGAEARIVAWLRSDPTHENHHNRVFADLIEKGAHHA